jgi:hypothetical protein
MKNKDENQKQKGFTVSQIEGTVQKYASEIGVSVIFIVTAIFTLIWGGSMVLWSILLCMILAVIGVVIPDSMSIAINKAVDFIYKEKIMLIVTGGVLLIVSIFIPVLIFALVGLLAGSSLSLSMQLKKQNVECSDCKDHMNHHDHNEKEI